ncbi:MAG: hypothetical protein R3C01_15075 [Planctomycetaceae bacterium]
MSRLITLTCLALLIGSVAATSVQAQHGYNFGNSYGGYYNSSNYGQGTSCQSFNGNYNYANNYGQSYGNPYVGNYGQNYNNNFRVNNYSGLQSYSTSYRQPTYYNRTHLDYHPASVVRHHGHYDVLPAHYDIHRAGRYGR